MNVDLTTPSPDLGLRMVIEATTDPAVRHAVATDPTVLALAARAVELPAAQRRHVSRLYDANHILHRVPMLTIRRRVRNAGGPDHLTVRALNERLHDLLDCPGTGTCQPYHTCETTSFALAVQDACYAHLAAGYLTVDERRIFTAAWADAAC